MTEPSELLELADSSASALLTEIINHFATAKESPGDWWAHDDDYSSYCLDHKSKDGTVFWLDLEDDGTIRIVWKPANEEKLRGMTFVARYDEPITDAVGDVGRAWPAGCHDPDSCARHKTCMYIRCRHEGRSIAGEVEAANKNPDGGAN
jgi:hypothetical protein